MYKSYTSFVKFILKYFILYDAIIDKIVFLISFLYCLLLIDFCILLWYITPFLNLPNSSNKLLVDHLGFSIHKIMLFAINLDAFYFFFLLNCALAPPEQWRIEVAKVTIFILFLILRGST